MQSLTLVTRMVCVAPLVGARVEITMLHEMVHLYNVAPLVGARVEIEKESFIVI